MIYVEMLKLDLISDFLLQLLYEFNEISINFGIRFFSVHCNHYGCI